MVKVYFQEKNGYSYIVAIFDSEDLYLACLSRLKTIAHKRDCIITESIDTTIDIDNILI